MLEERFTVERYVLLLLVLFTVDDEDRLLLVTPSIAALPKARPTDLKNPDELLWLLLTFPIRFAGELNRFLTVAFSVLLSTAD